MKNILVLIVFLLSFTLAGWTQSNGFKGGFQFKPMLGSGVFNNDPVSSSIDSVTITINQKFGYSFGMTIRKEFTKNLAIESGLRFTQRNYTSNIDSINTEYSGNIDYRMIAYEIPIKAIVMLRASDNSFFNVSLGTQIDLYPSDIGANDYEWKMELLRKSWVQGSFIANLGWEVHPVNRGTFYFGLAYNQPFANPFTALFGEVQDTYASASISQTGTFFSLDFRYYFEDKKEKTRK